MVVEYLITTKTLTTKKLRRNQQKVKIFFVKFQAPFSQKIIDIQLSISCMYSFYMFNSFESGDCQMIYTITISLLTETEKPFYLLRPQSFSFQIVSEFILIHL